MNHSRNAVATRPVLAIASANPGKLREFESLLGSVVDVRSLSAYNVESPEETGETFEDNAVLKARHLHQVTGAVVLADDSGLEVAALNGDPGVRSARYAGDAHDDAANRALLLERMADVPDGQRDARFVASIALIDTEGKLTVVHGTCEGVVIRSGRGTGGFGYDSLFELPNGKTMAELAPEEKNAISHRARAIELIIPHVRQALGLPEVPEADPA